MARRYSNLYKEASKCQAEKKTQPQFNSKHPPRERLMDIGKKGETYDDIINNLIDLWLKKKKK